MLKPAFAERQNIIKKAFGPHPVIHAASQRFSAYFDYYCSTVCPASCGDDVLELDSPALEIHAT